MSSGPHEMVNIAELLVLGGLADTIGRAWSAIYHGNVKIEQWTIGIGEGTLPRWVLRNVTISLGDRAMKISDDASRILRTRDLSLV